MSHALSGGGADGCGCRRCGNDVCCPVLVCGFAAVCGAAFAPGVGSALASEAGSALAFSLPCRGQHNIHLLMQRNKNVLHTASTLKRQVHGNIGSAHLLQTHRRMASARCATATASSLTMLQSMAAGSRETHCVRSVVHPVRTYGNRVVRAARLPFSFRRQRLRCRDAGRAVDVAVPWR